MGGTTGTGGASVTDAGSKDAGGQEVSKEAGADTGSGDFAPCPATGDCKVLALGDSITWGINYGGGYRIKLFTHTTTDGTTRRLPSTATDVRLAAGDLVSLETPGGGGAGDPLARDPAQVLRDLAEGRVTAEAAERVYGVVVAGGTLDAAATARRRGGRAAGGG